MWARPLGPEPRAGWRPASWLAAAGVPRWRQALGALGAVPGRCGVGSNFCKNLSWGKVSRIFFKNTCSITPLSFWDRPEVGRSVGSKHHSTLLVGDQRLFGGWGSDVIFDQNHKPLLGFCGCALWFHGSKCSSLGFVCFIYCSLASPKDMYSPGSKSLDAQNAPLTWIFAVALNLISVLIPNLFCTFPEEQHDTKSHPFFFTGQNHWLTHSKHTPRASVGHPAVWPAEPEAVGVVLPRRKLGESRWFLTHQIGSVAGLGIWMNTAMYCTMY